MDVFLFPLVNVTLFPRSTRPFNIFEPRYVEMVRDAVQTRTPVALGFIDDPLAVAPVTAGEPVPFVRPIAGYGTVQIIEERVNGTLLVFVQGMGKCRLGEAVSEDPYIVCRAEPIRENRLIDASLTPKIQTMNRLLARWIAAHIPEPEQREAFLRNLEGPEDVVAAFASYLVRDFDLQQAVLEIDGLNDKVLFLYRLIESNEVSIS